MYINKMNITPFCSCVERLSQGTNFSILLDEFKNFSLIPTLVLVVIMLHVYDTISLCSLKTCNSIPSERHLWLYSAHFLHAVTLHILCTYSSSLSCPNLCFLICCSLLSVKWHTFCLPKEKL